MLLDAIYAQITLLILTGLWIAFSKRRTAADTAIKVIATILFCAGLGVGGVWFYPPLSGLLIAALVFVGLFIAHLRKTRSQTTLLRSIISNAPLLILIPLGSFLLWQGTAGRFEPKGDAIALDSPFKSAEGICVLSGGLSPLLNFHNFPSDSPRDIAQTYGLDIIRVGPNGFRTRPEHRLDPKPKDMRHYAMFDTAVYSPCDGKVVEYENDSPDQAIGESDKINTGGNGVVLKCGTHHVHLHHLKHGSVLTQLGEIVKAGQKIGHIGNSGNTIEPHLHIHAETIVEDGNTKRHGNPVHMSFGDRFMARGDCF
ncbi:MAG: M23 family metallopeptidase [Parasphingorhabdus sp.]|uniref:M23 family metallopeptidase n=1 Tax=Parasphingorhabdus sp. TaxID=2709688 RepID=UPI003299F10F